MSNEARHAELVGFVSKIARRDFGRCRDSAAPSLELRNVTQVGAAAVLGEAVANVSPNIRRQVLIDINFREV